MKPVLCCAVAALCATAPRGASAQHAEPADAPVEGVDFRVYDGRGRSQSFADILAVLDRSDALLVGETHDDAVGHGVEAELLVRAAERFGVVGEGAGAGRDVVLSLEMFERDVQYIVDEYMSGFISEDQFRRSARPWDRYETDYRPMVEFARAHGLPVVAANAPRRYVNRVSRLGAASLEELPASARAFLPPLPYPPASEEYARQWNALLAEMSSTPAPPDSAAVSTASPRPTPALPRHDAGAALQAQALWDAAMGEAVASALAERSGALVIHYAGSFHVARGTGIPERVADYRPGTRVVTVVLEPAGDVDAWSDEEHRGLGDFVVLTRRAERARGAAPGATP